MNMGKHSKPGPQWGGSEPCIWTAIKGITAAAAIIAAFVVPLTASASTTVPSCRTVVISENSGAGPNFQLKVCNSGPQVITNPGTGKRWVLIVDGGALPEHSTRQVTVAIAETKVAGR
jgi:hypothetical protein